MFAPNVPWAWKTFEAHSNVLLGDIGQVEARFRPFGNCIKPDAT
jgi:hypothetical protein